MENVEAKNHPHTTICLSNHYILIFVLFAYIPLNISRNDVLEDVFRFLCTRGENFPYQPSSFERVLWLLSVLLHKPHPHHFLSPSLAVGAIMFIANNTLC